MFRAALSRASSGLFALSLIAGPQPDVKTIIERSVAANDKDFEAAPRFNYKEKDFDGKSHKTFQVTMIDGTPYQRLIALEGKPLSSDQAAEEMRKQEKEAAQRLAESPSERSKRIADYEKERKRDHSMMSQLTKAFDFKITGTRKIKQRTVWVLDATPKPSYQPPNMESQVLPGMRGEMWIDQQTYEWLKVNAEVIRPVSIEGFLAQVEPGTRFGIEKVPVAPGIWQISHFTMESHAKVLYMINKSSQEDDWYYDFKPAHPGGKTKASKSAAPPTKATR